MEKSTTGVKHDGAKPTPQYIDPIFVFEMSAGMAFGAHKYGAWNYIGGFKWTRLIGGIFRHMLLFSIGVDYDKESGISHLALAGCGINMLFTHWRSGKGIDDRLKLDLSEEHIDRIYKNLESLIDNTKNLTHK